MKFFKYIDLLFFTLLASFSLFSSHFFFSTYGQSSYILNFVILIMFITVIRWGVLGVIVYAISSLVMILFFNEYMMYIIFEVFIVSSLLLIYIKLMGSKLNAIDKKSGILNIIYLYLIVVMGKSLSTIIVLDSSFLDVYIINLSLLLFEMTISIIVFLIVRRSSGLLVNFGEYYKVKEEVDCDSN